MSKRNQHRARRFRGSFKKYPLASESDWRRLRANYYGLISLVDRAVGEILEALEASGRADDTMVLFTSDHGDMLGDHAILGKSVMYEEAVRVPLLMRIPWLDREPARIEEPVSQIDLLPTLLDLVGVEAPPHLPGESLAGVLHGEEPVGDGHVVIEWNPEWMLDRPIRTVISRDRWKLNVYAADRWELFDLSSDPFERVNLFGREDQGERVRGMYDALRKWQASVDDPVRFPEPGHSPGLVHWLRRAVGYA
jgi:arylsulfatase A-like enzyme